MKKYAVGLLASLVCVSAIATESLTMTPDAMTKYIDAHGAKATVDKLYSSKGERQWDTVMQKVAAGSASWIAVAAKLADGADAGSAESLQVNLARALPNNPSQVLPLVGSKSFLGYSDVCGAPFIEPTHAFLMGYFTKAKKALDNLQDPKIEQQRKMCLAEIEKGIAEEAPKH